eukprot:scaffold13034_cov21-Prasinocladus_malaysianus.AAC.2
MAYICVFLRKDVHVYYDKFTTQLECIGCMTMRNYTLNGCWLCVCGPAGFKKVDPAYTFEYNAVCQGSGVLSLCLYLTIYTSVDVYKANIG